LFYGQSATGLAVFVSPVASQSDVRATKHWQDAPKAVDWGDDRTISSGRRNEKNGWLRVLGVTLRRRADGYGMSRATDGVAACFIMAR